MSSLTTDQVALQLEGLFGWRQDGNSLVRRYEFDDFGSAIAFMTKVAFHCQALEHHPLWQNHYNIVDVRIGNADQSAVQSRDVQLAKRMQAAFDG